MIEAGGVANGTAGTPTADRRPRPTPTSTMPADTCQAVATGRRQHRRIRHLHLSMPRDTGLHPRQQQPDRAGAERRPSADRHLSVLTADGTAQTITITINGTNDAAVISGDTYGTVVEAGGVGSTARPEPRPWPATSPTPTSTIRQHLPGSRDGRSQHQRIRHLHRDAAGTWSYTLDNSNPTVQALNDGQSTTDTFSSSPPTAPPRPSPSPSMAPTTPP